MEKDPLTPMPPDGGQRSLKIAEWLQHLATMCHAQLSDEAAGAYVKELSHIRTEALYVGLRRLATNWIRPGVMPTLGNMLEAIAEHQQAIENELRSAVAMGDAEAKEFLAALENRRRQEEKSVVAPGVTREDIMRWLDEGKQSQRARIAALEADPQWRAMAEKLGAFPGLPAKKITTTQPQRNAFDTDADYMAAKQKWAHDEAEKQGWLSIEVSSPGGGVSEKDRKALAEWEQRRR